MKIILDAMGGDNAPEQIIIGGYRAANELETEIMLVGDENVIKSVCEKYSLTDKYGRVSVRHASQVITMEDSPLSVVREKMDSSMRIGLKALASDEGDAFVSAGNTGALHAGSSLIVKRIKGVQRSALAAILPFANPTLLLDAGANLELEPEQMRQLGLMGSLYMKLVLGVKNPRVALLNNGTEETKGTKKITEAYNLLKETDGINFIGNVEGKSAPYGSCDVLISDGFTGNVFLKTVEGLSMFVFKQVKGVLKKNIFTKLSALILKRELYGLKDKFNSSTYGGAPLLGLKKPVIKAHGSSDAEAIFNAVKQAMRFVDNGVIEEISGADCITGANRG